MRVFLKLVGPLPENWATHSSFTRFLGCCSHANPVRRKRKEKIENSILLKSSLRHYHHQSYSQLPNFSGQEWKSMGKSSRCIGHSACTVNLHPIHRKLRRLCKCMKSKQHSLGTVSKTKKDKNNLTSTMHYSRRFPSVMPWDENNSSQL